MNSWNELVGKRYTCWGTTSDKTAVDVVRWDPRAGLWVRDIFTKEERCISERAIDRTFHRLTMSTGSDMLLSAWVALGRCPQPEEVPGLSVEYYPQILEKLKLFEFVVDGILTEKGRAYEALSPREKVDYN